MLEINRLIFIFMVLFHYTLQEKIDRDCWANFGKSQYRLFTNAGGVTFDTANNLCIENNSTFISIQNKEENDFVHNMMKMTVPIPVWIGLKRIGSNMYWMDGNIVNYVFDIYETISNMEACVYIFDSWMEGPCRNELYFFCKRNASHDQLCDPDSLLAAMTTDISTQDSTQTTSDFETKLSGITNNGQSEINNGPTKTFEELIEDLRIKKKPEYKAVEAPGGKTIGSIAVVILVAIIVGIVLLDLSTIQNHLKFFIRNLRDFCCKRK